MDQLNLDKFCQAGGCSSKLDPALLHNILSNIPKKDDPNLLIGFDSSDDGAVYKLSDDIAIISTLDFFTPITDDPYTFGKIAATNALSDIYAMGGEPKICLNIVAISEDSPSYILEMLKGGSEKALEASATICGGHSIKDNTTKYGLSVVGTVHPDKIIKNNSCKIGDSIILTKPIGTGIIMSAYLLDDCPKYSYEKCIHQMQTLNKYAFDIAKKYNINAMTDVTGFGFLGHLNEMSDISYSILVNSKNVQILENALELAKEFYITGNGQKNRNYLDGDIILNNITFEMQEILFDPQTSGGLLISLPSNEAEQLVKEMNDNQIDASIVAKVINRKNTNIIVE